MLPIAHVGISPDDLWSAVEGDRWPAWCVAEPDLASLNCLRDIRCLRGEEEDRPLAALLRLAATDGGDDQWAAIAVVHQLEPAVQKLVCQFRNLAGADVDGLVIGALWSAIRSFAWRTRKRGYAAALIRDTRASLVSLLLPDHSRTGRRHVTFLDPLDDYFGTIVDSAHPTAGDPFEPDRLGDFLYWALATNVVSRAEAILLLELVDADRTNTSPKEPTSRRGPCSLAAVSRVAERRGRCARTITRSRDAAITRLREASARYLAEVA
jgi:hypothetical protein